MVYLGGGCSDASEEVREFIARARLPVASTLMGLGVYPSSDELSLNMLGMHGTVYANYSVDQADLLVALGVRWGAGGGAGAGGLGLVLVVLLHALLPRRARPPP